MSRWADLNAWVAATGTLLDESDTLRAAATSLVAESAAAATVADLARTADQRRRADRATDRAADRAAGREVAHLKGSPA